jgi:PleD family two-component response regulator
LACYSFYRSYDRCVVKIKAKGIKKIISISITILLSNIKGSLQLLARVRSILVIDDESDIVNPIKRFLQKQGFKAYGFTDPLLAFEYFNNNSNSIDLVLCDIRMPQMNGYELIRRIKTPAKS